MSVGSDDNELNHSDSENNNDVDLESSDGQVLVVNGEEVEEKEGE